MMNLHIGGSCVVYGLHQTDAKTIGHEFRDKKRSPETVSSASVGRVPVRRSASGFVAFKKMPKMAFSATERIHCDRWRGYGAFSMSVRYFGCGLSPLE
jgi:hypothetical protein